MLLLGLLLEYLLNEALNVFLPNVVFLALKVTVAWLLEKFLIAQEYVVVDDDVLFLDKVGELLEIIVSLGTVR